MTKQYGQPFLLSGFSADSEATALVPFGYAQAKATEGHAYTEKWLQDLIAAHPEILPFAELGEPAFTGATSICVELPVAGKYLDNLLVTDQGYLVLVECKLWRNPEARRSVIGQILDYATEMSRWDYATLDQAVLRAEPAPGLQKQASLYARAGSPESLPETDFIDAVSRNLKRGRFLLLVVGDGIHEGIEAIAGFLQGHAGLHFTLGLAEMAVFRLPNGHYLAQPRVLARTVMIERGIVILKDERMEVLPPASTMLNPSGSTTLRSTRTISEQEMFNQLEAKEPSLSAKLQAFIESGASLGLSTQLTPTTIKLMGPANDELWPLGIIDPKNAQIWFSPMAKRQGQRDAALKYYRRLVDLLDDPALRQEKMAPGTKTGMRTLPLSLLLLKPELWILEIEEYLKVIGLTQLQD